MKRDITVAVSAERRANIRISASEGDLSEKEQARLGEILDFLDYVTREEADERVALDAIAAADVVPESGAAGALEAEGSK
jgi:hypothetical protein